MKQNVSLLLVMLLALVGCDVVETTQPAPAPAAAPAIGVGKSAASLDSTTQAQKAAALAAPKGGARQLGRAVVALGNPAEQGFWLTSALVTVPGKGHVVTEGGGSIAVELRPGEGAALLSLAAFRALGLGLTDLPEVAVYAN